MYVRLRLTFFFHLTVLKIIWCTYHRFFQSGVRKTREGNDGLIAVGGSPQSQHEHQHVKAYLYLVTHSSPKKGLLEKNIGACGRMALVRPPMPGGLERLRAYWKRLTARVPGCLYSSSPRLHRAPSSRLASLLSNQTHGSHLLNHFPLWAPGSQVEPGEGGDGACSHQAHVSCHASSALDPTSRHPAERP